MGVPRGCGAQLYGASATFAWTPSIGGSYIIVVQVRTNPAVAEDAYVLSWFTVTNQTPATAVSFSGVPGSPITAGYTGRLHRDRVRFLYGGQSYSG